MQGLLPLYIHPQTGDATTQMVSLGAMGDSYYEYLLKVWIYKGRRKEDDMYRGTPDPQTCHLLSCTSLTRAAAEHYHLLAGVGWGCMQCSENGGRDAQDERSSLFVWKYHG